MAKKATRSLGGRINPLVRWSLHHQLGGPHRHQGGAQHGRGHVQEGRL